jgi:hypothetical protein
VICRRGGDLLISVAQVVSKGFGEERGATLRDHDCLCTLAAKAHVIGASYVSGMV